MTNISKKTKIKKINIGTFLADYKSPYDYKCGDIYKSPTNLQLLGTKFGVDITNIIDDFLGGYPASDIITNIDQGIKILRKIYDLISHRAPFPKTFFGKHSINKDKDFKKYCLLQVFTNTLPIPDYVYYVAVKCVIVILKRQSINPCKLDPYQATFLPSFLYPLVHKKNYNLYSDTRKYKPIYINPWINEKDL
jgi:hypothetical protein